MVPRKDKYAIAPVSEGIYKANCEKLDKHVINVLNKTKEKAIPVEDDVKVHGLKNPVCTIVVGLATDEVIKSILKLDKNIKHIVVIEPDIAVFKQTVRRKFIAPYLKDSRFDFIIGVPVEELNPALFNVFSATVPHHGPRAATCQAPEVIPDPFIYNEKNPQKMEELNAISRTVGDVTQRIFLSMGCAPDTFARWEQTVRNEKNMLEGLSMKNLVGKFKDMPAIVLGAGPSLQDFIDNCKKFDLENKSVIVACDASLRRLKAEGIKPHFVVRCERKPSEIFNGIEREDTRDTFYVGYTWTPPEYFDLWDEKFIAFRNNGINNFCGVPHKQINGGVSAANAAIEVAWELGCKDIILSGIDCCFIDGKTHLSGTTVEFNVNASKGKWEKIINNSGEEVETIPVWKRCLGEYIQSVSKYKQKTNTNVINTSLKGAQIIGTKLMPFSETEKYYNGTYDVVTRIRDNATKISEEDKKKFLDKKQNALDHLKGVKVDITKMFAFLEDTMKNASREEYKTMEQMKAHYNPEDYFANVHQIINISLEQVYAKACKEVEELKLKLYPDKIFSDIVLDTAQLDLFKMENKINSLPNKQPIIYQRHKTFISVQTNFWRVVLFYVDALIDLFENGGTLAADFDAKKYVAQEVPSASFTYDLPMETIYHANS